MITGVRYVHTNLIARDWQALARFYEIHFGCVPVPPERDYAGPELEAGTGVRGARVRGIHLRLPGFGNNGPTLEIFSYAPQLERGSTAANQAGLGHVAFTVDSVTQARDEVLGAGGRAVGEIVRSRRRPAPA
jgi:glyoxylase I family protein